MYGFHVSHLNHPLLHDCINVFFPLDFLPPVEYNKIKLDITNHFWTICSFTQSVQHFSGKVHYWYAEKERKARAWDLKYMKKFVPDTDFKSFAGMDYGDMALF